MPRDIGDVVNEILQAESISHTAKPDIQECYCPYEGPRPKYLARHYDGSGLMLFVVMLVAGLLGFSSFAATTIIIAIRSWAG